MKNLNFRIVDSPVGKLKLVANIESLIAVLWDNDKENRVRLEGMDEMFDHPILIKTEQQLKEYFNNQRKVFDVPIQFNGTPFQKSIWQALLEIPYGVTWTYKQVASKIGRPLSVRAVGGTIGRNPISIIAPCHRVIGSNGNLTGFAGGLDRKKMLLNVEKIKY